MMVLKPIVYSLPLMVTLLDARIDCFSTSVSGVLTAEKVMLLSDDAVESSLQPLNSMALQSVTAPRAVPAFARYVLPIFASNTFGVWFVKTEASIDSYNYRSGSGW